MNITFRQLRVFAEVARQASVQRAAEVLHLTPQAVSMQIREIESQVGLILFDRAARRLTLSTAGEYFLLYARRLLATLKETQDAMSRFKRVESGVLSIGMVSPAKYFLPQLLALFRAEHPGVDVRLRFGNSEQLVAMMQANEVDMSVMGRAPRDWPNRAEPFAPHPHVLVTAADHAFAGEQRVPVAALAREAFIVREAGSGTRAALEEYLHAQRIQPMLLMEMPSDEAIKQAVMAGLGISLVSRHIIGLELKHGLIAAPPIDGLPLQRRWHLVTGSAKMLSPAAEAFRYFMLERGREHLARLMGTPDGDAQETQPAR
ncbi:MAG: LysR family transcriptional regulator [Rubrivivax sp.]|jgi:DNA-binding transcriptional LysR family regulator|nr:LysR family transcriptional regulator [Rubrivivax sp.]